MARAHAQILTSIWNDEDFRALSPEAQHMYLFLLSQPDLNFAGVLVYRPKRWAVLADGWTIEAIEAALAELEATWFVAVDRDVDEVLIRSLIRNDGVYKQPNVFRAACRDASGTLSRTLRGILRSELERIPLIDLSPSVREKAEAEMKPLLSALPPAISKPFTEPFAEPFGEGFPEPSQEPFPEPPGEGEGEVVNGSVQTEKSKPKTAPRKADAAGAKKTPRPESPESALAGAITKRFYDHVKGECNFLAVKGVVVKFVRAGHEERAIVDALAALDQDGVPVTATTMRAQMNGTRRSSATAVATARHTNPADPDAYKNGWKK